MAAGAKVRRVTSELEKLRAPRVDFGRLIRDLMRHVTLEVITETCRKQRDTLRRYRDDGVEPRDQAAQTIRALHRHFCGEQKLERGSTIRGNVDDGWHCR